MTKKVSGDCQGCESAYEVKYVEQTASSEYPEFCPFCGEHIDEITEEYIDDVDSDDEVNGEWD